MVTGLGVATPLGLDVETSWQRALAGVPAVRKLNYPLAHNSPVQAVGDITKEDLRTIEAEFPQESRAEGESKTLFALWAAKRAIEDARALSLDGDRQRYGVSIASGLGINRLEDIDRWVGGDGKVDFRRFGRAVSEVHRESLMRNNSHRTSARIAGMFGFRGVTATVTAACASATMAIGLGFRSIRRGDSDVVLVGGADSMINPVGLVFFVLLGAASASSDDPARICRPFDRKRSGLVMGEGAAVAVLEEESHAVRRGARIYAEVAGYGSSLDAYQVTAPEPQGRGAAASMKEALSDAELEPDQIDYINAHGTSTKLNDVAETVAIKHVFGDQAYRLAISSSKPLIGHLLAASGAPEFVFTVLSVQRDEIHPTVNLTNPDPRCDLDYVPNVGRSRKVGAALSNSFGFGGQNASIIVKKYHAEP